MVAVNRGQPQGLYLPEPLESGGQPDSADVARYIQKEFGRIGDSFNFALARNVEFLNVAPTKPRTGMIRGADGTNWNPGYGQGVYCYYNGAWNLLIGFLTGTWTPNVGGNTTYTIQEGLYVRFGKLCFVQAKLVINVLGTGSANTVSGLPFTAVNPTNASPAGGGSVTYFDQLATAVTWLSVLFQVNAKTLVFPGVTGAATTMTSAINVFQDSTRIDFAGVYQTA